MNFYMYFPILFPSGLGDKIAESVRALAQMLLTLRKPTRWTAGSIVQNPEGSYVKKHYEAVLVDLHHPIDYGAHRLNPLPCEPVHPHSHWIKHPRPIF